MVSSLKCWKHPRIRGENERVVAVTNEPQETSPHTRGEPQAVGQGWQNRRNIPAYAGRTSQQRDLCARYWKHPRIRGENLTSDLSGVIPIETSPHTRGERWLTSLRAFSAGNIPAYAGRTLDAEKKKMVFEKHPRIRGENTDPFSPKRPIQETSPHTRGELPRLQSHFQ